MRAARALLTGMTLAVATPAAGQQQGPPQPPPQITTSAQGESMVTPDRARINLAVETRGATAAAAATENARIQSTVLARLRALGIPDNQLGTWGYNVSPEYQYDRDGSRPRIIAYVARNTVRADVHDISKVGGVIDAALAAGANNVGGLEFYSSSLDEARGQALAQAVTRARSDATVMAAAAGGRLGPLIELSSSSYSPQPPMPMYAMEARTAAQVDTQINPGEQKMVVNVTARWQFIPGM